jgi:hypothetical protein
VTTLTPKRPLREFEPSSIGTITSDHPGVEIIREGLPHPEDALFDRLEETHGDGAHSRYNALIRRMVSFARAAAITGQGNG